MKGKYEEDVMLSYSAQSVQWRHLMNNVLHDAKIQRYQKMISITSAHRSSMPMVLSDPQGIHLPISVSQHIRTTTITVLYKPLIVNIIM